MKEDPANMPETSSIDLSGVELLDEAELDLMRQTVMQMAIMGVIKLLTGDKSDRKQLGSELSELYAEVAVQEELHKLAREDKR